MYRQMIDTSCSYQEVFYMEEDLTAKNCLSVDARYADLVNGLLLGGEQVLSASDLHELDSQQWNRQEKRKTKYRQAYRDLIKKTAFGVNFSLIGVENQKLVHYLMPLRTMEYDAASYRRQASKIAKLVKETDGVTDAEFLSGFRKEDKLYPCVTIVLYYGDDWDGAKSLHDLLDLKDIPESLKKYINDYKVHMFDVMHLDTSVFRTDLKQIFSFIQCEKDKQKLKELVESDSAYRELEEDAYDMIAAYTKAEKFIAVKDKYKEKEKVDMCQALNELLEDSRLAGVEQGIEQGMFRIVYKKIKKNYTLDMIADDLEEEVEVIRPLYERALREMEENNG